MPLREAKWEVEKLLVDKAYTELGSTYKAADALQCDQSTVAKLMKKHGLGKENNGIPAGLYRASSRP